MTFLYNILIKDIVELVLPYWVVGKLLAMNPGMAKASIPCMSNSQTQCPMLNVEGG